MIADNTLSLVVPHFRAVLALTTSVDGGFEARAWGSM